MEPIWCNHLSFRTLVNQAFVTNLDLLTSINCFQKHCKDWNKHTFGNIFKQLRVIRARLESIQKFDSFYHSSFLQNFEKELSEEHDSLLKTEKDFWITKSRINCLSEEDANTNFFQTATLVMRRRNKIMSLEDDTGRVHESKQDILNHNFDLFRNLYQSDHLFSKRIPLAPGASHNASNSHDMQLFDSPLRDSEIIQALKSFKPLKAPGPDRLHHFLYQRY